MLPADRRAEGHRLACQCRVQGPLTVEVPEASLFQAGQKILTRDAGGELQVRPAVTKRFLNLAISDREDPLSDAERLRGALGSVEIDIDVMRSLPHVLRESGFQVTATVVNNRVVDVQPGDRAEGCYGVAFDIGTTTLVGTLVDLTSGADLAVAGRMNPQTSFGDDVISRIRKCRDEADGLRVLQKAVSDAVNGIIGKVTRAAGVDRKGICEAVFAGNTTMQQILCGINPRALGEMPFVPAFREPLRMRALDLELDVNDDADVYIFPQIGGFVGGDTVAGIIATRLDRMEAPALLVDVGTNGEIVLALKGQMMATSVAAGPAFEGARIVNGMRAASGAIEKVVVNGDDIRINVINDARPSGICGTGLIDATAALLRLGLLDPTGRIVDPAEAPASTPPAIVKRVVEQDGQFHFRLADATETANGEPLYLFQKDIRELQLANGAIRAGISILLKMAGLATDELGSILLAGAFGNFIRRNNARRIGMLPQVPTERIRFVGNTASFGAKRVLLSIDEREYAARVARETRHVDLSLNPEFQNEFSEAMMFPEGE